VYFFDCGSEASLYCTLRDCWNIGVGAGKFLGNFAQIFPNLPEKFLCDFCPQIFYHKNNKDLFLMWPPKKGFHVVFCKRRLPFFEVKQGWAPFLHRLSGILSKFFVFAGIFRNFGQMFGEFTRIFNKSKFCGCACTLASYTTALEKNLEPFWSLKTP